MTDTFTPASRAIFDKKVLAHVASLDADGAPNVSPVWVELDGDDIVINTALGRAKARNLASDSRVAVSLDRSRRSPGDHHGSRHGRGLHDRRRRRRHRSPGEEVHGARQLSVAPPGEVRVTVKIQPDRISRQPE